MFKISLYRICFQASSMINHAQTHQVLFNHVSLFLYQLVEVVRFWSSDFCSVGFFVVAVELGAAMDFLKQGLCMCSCCSAVSNSLQPRGL